MDEAHGPYSAKSDPRKFDHERYELSKLLEDIIRNIGNRGCFFTEYENFFIVEHFVVQSAYVGKRVKLPGGIRKKKVTFRTLVTKALAGARPKRPP